MRTLIVTSGVAIVAIATLVWMHEKPRPAGVAQVTAAAPQPKRSPPVRESKAEAVRPIVIAENRAERVVQDIERALLSFDAQERESIFTDMLPELIALDPAAAGRLVERLERGPARDQLREHVAQQWTARDPEGATHWVESLENDDERKLAASDVITQLARSDPAVAIELADQFEVGRADGRIQHLAQTWAETNLEEALAWTQSQPRGPERDQLLARIAAVQAARDPARAAELVSNEMSPGATRGEAALSVLREWASRDPDAAAQWAARFPDSSVREQAMAELARAARLRQ